MTLKGLLRVGGWLLLIVGAGAGGAAVLVKTALAIASGELEHTPRRGTARLLRVYAEPGEFWFQVSMNVIVSVVLVAFFAIAMAIVLKAKRASGRTWAEFIAGIANAPAPPGPPTTSRAGNIVAWILLVPFLLIMAAFVVWLVSLK